MGTPARLLFSELSRTHSNSVVVFRVIEDHCIMLLQLSCCFPSYRGLTPTHSNSVVVFRIIEDSLKLSCCFPNYRGPLHHASPTQLLFSELSRTHSNSLQLGCCFPNYRGLTQTQLLFSELSRTHSSSVVVFRITVSPR